MKTKSTLVTAVLIGVLGVALGCSNGEAAGTPADNTAVEPEPVGSAIEPSTSIEPAGQSPDGGSVFSQGSESAPPASGGTAASVPVVVAEPATLPVGAPEGPTAAVQVARSEPAPPVFAPSARALSLSPVVQVAGGQTGIWVTGQGSVALEPDLALLNIGVETMAATVSEARDQAARAMAAILEAVRARGLADIDVQTRSFNIYPQYDYSERTRVLLGYMVSNTATIKIRDLDSVGPIIDDVADAGGDATRINGISFTVEDPQPFMVDLREAAVEDALAKAQQFASLTGVAVGQLVFISELGGGGGPVVQTFAEDAVFAVKAAAPTSVSGGELELTLSVQAVFAIQ